jgi:ABC-2 type transport system ATP-binding protein
MISIKNLSVNYGQKIALDNINCTFELEKTHGIVGLNGAGKTSFFSVLAQATKAQLGEICYNNKPLHYGSVSYLETQPFFYSRITGREYLAIFPNDNAQLNEEKIIALLKIPLDNFIATYSTGEQKKLALMGILKQNRPIIILDEPFNGLDLESAKILETIILRLKEKNKTIFISSHILSPLFNLCDWIHHLSDGHFQHAYLPCEFDQLDNHIFGELRANAQSITQQFL